MYKFIKFRFTIHNNLFSNIINNDMMPNRLIKGYKFSFQKYF